MTNIRDFATPDQLAEKVVNVERAKEGTFEVEVVSAKESTVPLSTANMPAYVIEYKVDSSRGQNHYKVKASVVSSYLYVFTVQTKENDYAGVVDVVNTAIDSLGLASASPPIAYL